MLGVYFRKPEAMSSSSAVLKPQVPRPRWMFWKVLLFKRSKWYSARAPPTSFPLLNPYMGAATHSKRWLGKVVLYNARPAMKPSCAFAPMIGVQYVVRRSFFSRPSRNLSCGFVSVPLLRRSMSRVRF
jgi:hypothetical protein